MRKAYGPDIRVKKREESEGYQESPQCGLSVVVWISF